MSANNKKKKKLEEECSTTTTTTTTTRVYKRRRNVEDIISNLPDHILHHIFSFVDMKQAIQTTCLLSKRWRYFWVSLPTLKFRYKRETVYQQTITNGDSMNFVDRVLMLRSSNSNIHEFVTVNDSCLVERDHLNTWILVCVIRNVQQLTLDVKFPYNFQFHQCLFTCKSLMKLVVRARYDGVISISLPDSISLPRLKTLSLTNITFKDEYVMDQLFSSCPILESLTLFRCQFPHINVKISSPLLQHLELNGCGTRSNALFPVDTKFQLWAPNLISFYCYNNMSIHCDPKNLSSLVKAYIRTDELEDSQLSEEKKPMYAPFMVNLLRGIHIVEDLTLSTAFLEVITGAPDLLDSQPTKFGNLRCLKLVGEWLSIDCIHGISYLLKISPNIETLSIEDWRDVENAATDLLDVQPTQFCNLRCLKMYTVLSRDWIYAIACLLKICPNTETLSYTVNHEDEYLYKMNDMNPYWDEINSDPAIKRDYWEAGLSLECLLNHLKCFELRNVTGRINELGLLEILLKNAMLLEKLLINFRKTYSVDVDVDVDVDEERRRVKFTEKVLTFPRASSSVVILFR